MNWFKKILLFVASLAVVLLLIVSIGFTVFTQVGNLCGVEILHTEYSKFNDTNKAVIFISNCGATTKESVNISIIDDKDLLSDDSHGNIFISYIGNEVDSVSLSWESSQVLRISNADFETIFKQEVFFKDIEIKY